MWVVTHGLIRFYVAVKVGYEIYINRMLLFAATYMTVLLSFDRCDRHRYGKTVVEPATVMQRAADDSSSFVAIRGLFRYFHKLP